MPILTIHASHVPNWEIREYENGECDVAQTDGPGLSPMFDEMPDAILWIRREVAPLF